VFTAVVVTNTDSDCVITFWLPIDQQFPASYFEEKVSTLEREIDPLWSPALFLIASRLSFFAVITSLPPMRGGGAASVTKKGGRVCRYC
jgi:hypothetical protein